MDEALKARIDGLVKNMAAPIIDKINKGKKISNDEALIVSIYLILVRLDDIRGALEEIARGVQRLNELPPVLKQYNADTMAKLNEILEELKKMQSFGVEVS
ncbi:hypothetical protein [Thermoproteus tenax]|uniref:Uncharacterized protein n=1 Tax=Thermoproteus tenax (strain ATCC 35583 / DSM 2078 / JCM 9277 / NBRC 100435 / Kra 1) TaxID=768679 RepID=G4RPJ5_THETK|nr:hypothetical protein [Thermoproteus tenax]CCC81490.1 conserved hypothetical protein [Thermoproteus tenax Kra 1]